MNIRLKLNRQSKIDVLVLLVVLILGYVGVHNAVSLGDWLHDLVYSPPPQVVQLADEAGMNAEGKKLFYRFSPELVNPSVLQQKCGSDKLGCTSGLHIYIMNSNDPAQQARNIVTAAHEMLHVAYSRLSKGQQHAVDTEINQELNSNDGRTALNIKQGLRTYPTTDYYNEAHSYVGSELWPAGPALDAYYVHYFDDRAKTARAFLASPEGQ